MVEATSEKALVPEVPEFAADELDALVPVDATPELDPLDPVDAAPEPTALEPVDVTPELADAELVDDPAVEVAAADDEPSVRVPPRLEVEAPVPVPAPPEVGASAGLRKHPGAATSTDTASAASFFMAEALFLCGIFGGSAPYQLAVHVAEV
jgi:hypothetical protein